MFYPQTVHIETRKCWKRCNSVL